MSNKCIHKVVDAPEFGFDYKEINDTIINLENVELDNHENFMDALMHKYPPIYSFFISELFHEYSGIGNPKDYPNLIGRLDEILSEKEQGMSNSGEVFGFASNKDITEIRDYSPTLSDPDANPITITLPTKDFKQIVEHLIKNQN